MQDPIYPLLERVLWHYLKENPDSSSVIQMTELEEPSPCVYGAPNEDNEVLWRPLPSESPLDWSLLEQALQSAIRPELKAFYQSFWCGQFEVRTPHGPAILNQFWNAAERHRRIAGLVGRALETRSRGQGTLLALAITLDGGVFSCENASGQVFLEYGDQPELVFESLQQFLESLLA